MQSNYRQYFFVTTALWLSVVAVPVQAESLKSILKTALVNDPVLLEARADEEGAYNRVEQAKSLHYPKVRLTGNSALAEKHKNKNSYSDTAITPGLELSLNLYAFGAINAEVEKNELTKQYYRHKYNEAREELGYTIGDLYLTAYDAKQSIKLLKKSLQRHKKMLGDMAVIVSNDPGRRSEYVQAKARQILVIQQINDTQRLLDSSLSRLSKYTGKSVSEESLQNPFKGLSRSLLKKKYTLTEKQKTPTFLAQQAELGSKIKDVEAEKAKQLPSIDLVGYATPDDQQVGLRFSWDVFNRSTKYTVKEKDSIKAAAKSRLERVIRDIEESARLATIEMKRSEVQLKTLKSQARETRKVVDFYKLQFGIARRSLIEVLNAEKELTDVELAQSSTQTQWNRAALNYLRSQGKIADWVGLSNASPLESQKNNVQYVDSTKSHKKLNSKLDEKLERETDKLLSEVERVKPNKKLSQSISTDKEMLKKEIAELNKQATELASKTVAKKTDQKSREKVVNAHKDNDNVLVQKGANGKEVATTKQPIATDAVTSKTVENSIEKTTEKPVEKKGLMARLLEKVGLRKDTQTSKQLTEKVNQSSADTSIKLTSLDEDGTSVAKPVKEVATSSIAKPQASAIKPSSITERVVKKSATEQPATEKSAKSIVKKTIAQPATRPSIITKRDDKIVHLVAPEKLAIVEQAIASSSAQSLRKDTVQTRAKITAKAKPIVTSKSDKPTEKSVEKSVAQTTTQKVADKASKPKVSLTSLGESDVVTKPVTPVSKKEKVVIEKTAQEKVKPLPHKVKVEKEIQQKVAVAKTIKPTVSVKTEPEREENVDDNSMRSENKPKSINLIDEVDSTEHFKD